jgi:hypothetical protein
MPQDIDMIINPQLRKLGISLMMNGNPIAHGNFHNIAILIVYAVSAAFLPHPIGIRFMDSLFFASLGFAAHLFEDALVFTLAILSSGRVVNMFNRYGDR